MHSYLRLCETVRMLGLDPGPKLLEVMISGSLALGRRDPRYSDLALVCCKVLLSGDGPTRRSTLLEALGAAGASLELMHAVQSYDAADEFRRFGLWMQGEEQRRFAAKMRKQYKLE